MQPCSAAPPPPTTAPPVLHFPPDVFRHLPLEPSLAEFVVEVYEGERNEDTDMFEGQGHAVFRNGDEYTGGFFQGMMEGAGKYTWKDGTCYEGMFKANQVRGSGKYTWSDGSMYEGELRSGLRHGQGVFKAAGGTPCYEGGWRRGLRDGQGKLTYDADGRVYYEGYWKDNLRDGQGTMTYASGNKYEGQWRADKKNGYGVMHWYNLRERYSGDWLEDLQSGFGEHLWMDDKPADGSVGILKQMCNIYRGEWAKGKREGEGTFLYSNGARYSGQWQDNVKEGYGVFIFDDGHTYEGLFVKDKPADPSSIKTKADETQQVQLYVDVMDLLPVASCDAQAEIARLEKLALQFNSELKKVYKTYCAMGEGTVENCWTMGVREFKRFVRDCRILGDVVSIKTVDNILYKMRRHHALQLQALVLRRQRQNQQQQPPASSTAPLPSRRLPYYDEEQQMRIAREEVQSLLFREFFEAIVRLAHHTYTSEDPSLPLTKATKRFILDRIAPYVIIPTQQPPGSPSRGNRGPASPTAASRQEQPAAGAPPPPSCPLDDGQIEVLARKYSSLHDSSSRRRHGASPAGTNVPASALLVTRRDVLRMVRDAGLLGPEDITFDDVMQVLRSLFNQFSRSSYLEETTDFTDLDTPLAFEDLKAAVTGLSEELTRRHKLKELGSLTNEAVAAPAVNKADVLKAGLIALLPQVTTPAAS